MTCLYSFLSLDLFSQLPHLVLQLRILCAEPIDRSLQFLVFFSYSHNLGVHSSDVRKQFSVLRRQQVNGCLQIFQKVVLPLARTDYPSNSGREQRDDVSPYKRQCLHTLVLRKVKLHFRKSAFLKPWLDDSFCIHPAQELVHDRIVVRIRLDFLQEGGLPKVSNSDIEHE